MLIFLLMFISFICYFLLTIYIFVITYALIKILNAINIDVPVWAFWRISYLLLATRYHRPSLDQSRLVAVLSVYILVYAKEQGPEAIALDRIYYMSVESGICISVEDRGWQGRVKAAGKEGALIFPEQRYLDKNDKGERKRRHEAGWEITLAV